MRFAGRLRSENVGMSNELGRRETCPPNILGFPRNDNRRGVSRSLVREGDGFDVDIRQLLKDYIAGTHCGSFALRMVGGQNGNSD